VLPPWGFGGCNDVKSIQQMPSLPQATLTHTFPAMDVCNHSQLEMGKNFPHAFMAKQQDMGYILMSTDGDVK
jgi:hypothetical protein